MSGAPGKYIVDLFINGVVTPNTVFPQGEYSRADPAATHSS